MKKLLKKLIEQTDKKITCLRKGKFVYLHKPNLPKLPKIILPKLPAYSFFKQYLALIEHIKHHNQLKKDKSKKTSKQYLYTVSEAAKFLGVSADTLRNWDEKGKLKSSRTKGGSRRYRLQQLRGILEKRKPQLLVEIQRLNIPVLPQQPNYKQCLITSAIILACLASFFMVASLLGRMENSRQNRVPGVQTAKNTGWNLADFLLAPFKNLSSSEEKSEISKGEATPLPVAPSKEVEELKNRVEALENKPAATVQESRSTWKADELAQGVTFTDLIGPSIIDSSGNVYAGPGKQPSLGTWDRKFYGIFANRFTLDSGGNLKVYGQTILGDTSADYIKLIGRLSNDIVPSTDNEISLGDDSHYFKKGRINQITYDTGSGNTWTTTTLTVNGISTLTGNVGIGGTATLSSALCLNGECKSSWTGSGNYTASNGITLSNIDFQLGGKLTRATGIDISSQNFGFLGGSVGIGKSNPSYQLETTGNVGIGGSLTTTSLTLANGGLSVTGLSALQTITGTSLTTTGNITSNGVLLAANGSASAPSYSFTNSTGTGFWLPASNLVALTTGGTPGTGQTINGLSINSTGNVGMGTTDPANALDIVRSGNPRLRITNGTNVITMGNDSNYGARINTPGNILHLEGSSGVRLGANTLSAPIVVVSNSGNVGIGGVTADTSPVLYTQSNGNVGIGTTGPAAQLQLSGSTALKASGTTWDNPSDERLKDVLASYGRGLDEILKVNPIIYTFKKGNGLGLVPDGEHIGIIAQQIQSVFPEAVKVGQNGYLSFNADPVIWAAVNAIKEQNENISNVKAESSNLQVKSQSLEERVKALENKIATSSATIASPSAEATASSITLKLTPPEVLLATQSARLVNLNIASDATISGKLTAYEATIQETFKSLGKTFLGETLVAGNLTVDGTMTVAGNSLNSMGTLSLQNSPLAKELDILNGLFVFDNNGNLAVSGKVLAEQFAVKKDKSSGIGKITAGSTEAVIMNKFVDQNSLVLVTSHTPVLQTLAVTAKNAGSFNVNLAKSESFDLEFDYLVVGQE